MRMFLVNILLLILAFPQPVSSDLIMGAYYNPGLKLGVQFGKKSSFVIGFENSVTGALFYGMPFAGVVGGVAFNVSQRQWIAYWEIEGGFGPIGSAFGGEWNKGYYPTIRIFGGALAFISYKHLFHTNIYEVSLIGKCPLPFYMVMDHGTYFFNKEIHHND